LVSAACRETFASESGFFYFPITTCVVISIILSAVIWFIRR
jgi:hypothetical protein